MTTDPLPPVVGRTTRRLAGRVRRAEAAISRNARASQAGRRSIEDGDTLPFYDPDGTIRVLIGADPDNPDTYTVQDVNGPALDRPSAPLIASTYEAVTITWDGFDADGQAGWPADFARLEVHASTVNPFTPTADTQIDAFRSPAGGTCTIPLPYDTPLWVRFVVVNTSGAQSVPSVARLAQSTNELADPVIYRPTVFGGAFSTADPDAPDEGQRIVVRNDLSGGRIEGYTGVDPAETPSTIDPQLLEGAPGIDMTSGTIPGLEVTARVRVFSGGTAASGGAGGAAVVEAIGGTVALVVDDDHIFFMNPLEGAILYGPLQVAGDVTVNGGGVLNGDLGDGSLGTGSLRDAIEAAADSRHRAGTDTVAIVTTGTPVSKTITFSTPFPASGPVPVVTAVVRSTNPQLFDVSVSAETRAGFVVTMNRSSGALAANFAWTAVLPV